MILKITFYLLIISIILLLYILFKSAKQNILTTILCSLIIFQIILTPKECISWTLEGTKLFFTSVFPSVFPFMVISNLMIYLGGIQIYSKLLGNLLCKPLKLPKECSIVLIINVLCGYPLGAKYACELYEKKIIDYNTCERLLNIASSVSPLFLISVVGTSMLNNVTYGYIILISSWLSCIAMGFIIPNNNFNYTPSPCLNYKTSNTNLGTALKESIDNSIQNCLAIGGFVTIFYIFTKMISTHKLFSDSILAISKLLLIDPKLLEGMSLGLLEITNGCYLISLSHGNILIKVGIISFLVAFSGLSIISQVYSFLAIHNFSAKKYISYKILQGFICSAISIVTSLSLTLLCFL